MVWLCAYYDFYDKKVHQCYSGTTPPFTHTFLHAQVASELLCNVVGGKLAPYLQEEGYIQLIQCFLNPQLMLCCPESITTTKKKIDPIHQLFVLSEHQRIGEDIGLQDALDYYFIVIKSSTIWLICSPPSIPHFFPLLLDQSDIDLRHSLANLVGVVLGCPTHSNHIWYHLFNPGELHETYMTGFMVRSVYGQDTES